MNKLYWMDGKGHIIEAELNLSQKDFSDAVQELISRVENQEL